MNWFNLIAAIGPTIQAIQLIHADKPGTTKKTIALQWLGLGEGDLVALEPALAPVIPMVNQSVGSIINSLVSLFHATNQPGFGNSPATPAVNVAVSK